MATLPAIVLVSSEHVEMAATDTFPLGNIPRKAFRLGTTATILTTVMDVLIHTGAAVTYTLPAANGVGIAGKQFNIVNHGSGAITYSLPVRTATGTTVTTLAAGAQIRIISDGAQWRRIGA